MELEMRDGIARITPLPLDHGMLAFTVAVYNDGEGPANFGIENVSSSFEGRTIAALSKDQLVRKAKNRAFWSQFGLALLGGVAAGVAANQRDVYTGSLITPRGTYSSIYTAPSVAGQWQAAGLTAATVTGVALIQLQLDQTIQLLGDEVVQTTTVDPGESYAGRIVLNKFDPGQLPRRLTVQLNWNGEAYPFEFQIAKRGTPAPPFTTLARQSDLRDRRPRMAKALPPAETIAPQVDKEQPPVARRGQAGSAAGFGNSRIRCVTCER